MTHFDHQYESKLEKVLREGHVKTDRTGTGTLSLFGLQLRYDLAKFFPLITTKRVFWRGVVEELLWILRGETNVRSLQEKGVHIWDQWADADGELGPIYGAQWRSWQAGDAIIFDQIMRVIRSIKKDPDGRRHIVSAWNVAELDLMALPPCHVLFQFYVADGRLSCQLYQRSADMFLGVPFNIASYALLTRMMAFECGLAPGEFIWTGGDCHIYSNHVEQVKEQLSRKPRPLPQLNIVGVPDDFFSYEFDHFELDGYDPHPQIKAPVAV